MSCIVRARQRAVCRTAPRPVTRLVIEGFLAELVERFAEGPIREAVAGALERRLAEVLGVAA